MVQVNMVKAEAQNLLGGLYNLGKGVTQDYQKAAEWYHQAASQGLQWAEINIGGLWFNGDGVAQNHVMAAYWFAKAEIGDDREASDQASHWVLRSKRVAERLQSRPIDYLNMAPEEREKLSHDDITAGLIGVAIASVVWAGVQSDWGNNIGPISPEEQHQRNVSVCINDKILSEMTGTSRSTTYGSYC